MSGSLETTPVWVTKLLVFYATGLALALVHVTSAGALQSSTPADSIQLNQETNLSSLLDLCAERLNLDIEYPFEELRRLNVTLRLGGGVTSQDLWTLTNRLLAAQGYTSIRMPGDGVLSIVKLTEATRLTRFLPAQNPDWIAGYSAVVLRAHHRTPAVLLASIKPLLTPTGGTASQLGETDFLLVADLVPRLDDILEFVATIDRPASEGEITVDRFPVANTDATQLVAQVTAAIQARDALAARPLRGRIAPSLGGDAVIIVAPEESLDDWRSLIIQFDEREPVETRLYLPRHFTNAEVSSLIERSVRPVRGGSGDRWRIVQDELTGTLSVTATQREHERIIDLLDRLDSVPSPGQRPMRTFIVRNRDVLEVKDLLQEMVDNVLLSPLASPERGSGTPSAAVSVGGSSTPKQSAEDPDLVQSTSRNGWTRGSLGGGTDLLALAADERTNALIVSGDTRILAQIESLVHMLDVRQPQVELQVYVVNLNEADTFDLGVELQKLEIRGDAIVGLSSLFGLSAVSPETDSPLAAGRGGSAVILSPGDFSVVVRALQTLSQGATRSYPKLLVNNNEQATLDAVRQEPFASTNASDTVATTSFGGTLDAGTQVSVTPHIASGDHLVLEYSVSLSAFIGDSNDLSLPPPRQQSSIQSVVTIPDGWTIAVGGLETLTEVDAVSQVPLLGSIPGLGELFKSRSRTQSRSRFFVFIRASVLRHNGFEDLRYLSDQPRREAGVADDWPTLSPRIVR